MLKRAELIYEFETRIPEGFAEKAARTTAHYAKDHSDLVLMLDMLGLIPPQPENRVKTKTEHRNELARERGMKERARIKAEREE